MHRRYYSTSVAACLNLGWDANSSQSLGTFAADPTGCAVVVPYSFGSETMLVAHVKQLPAGRSSVELAMQFAGFIAEVKAKVGATWLPVYTCCDVTKDRTVVDRLVEFGMGGTRNTGSVRLPQLTGVLFGGAGQQVSEAQPLFVTLPGRGRLRGARQARAEGAHVHGPARAPGAAAAQARRRPLHRHAAAGA